MVCQVCHRLGRDPLCGGCRSQLRPAADRILPGGLILVSAYEHAGPAKVLMHHLKYRGVTTYASVVAEEMAQRLSHLPVVPIPRALSRRVRYGVDPAYEIARRLNRPMLQLLAPPVHSPRRAGGDHSRAPARFRLRERYEGEVIVIDDVATSGATLMAAAEAIGIRWVRLVATANAVQISASARLLRVKASS